MSEKKSLHCGVDQKSKQGQHVSKQFEVKSSKLTRGKSKPSQGVEAGQNCACAPLPLPPPIHGFIIVRSPVGLTFSVVAGAGRRAAHTGGTNGTRLVALRKPRTLGRAAHISSCYTRRNRRRCKCCLLNAVCGSERRKTPVYSCPRQAKQAMRVVKEAHSSCGGAVRDASERRGFGDRESNETQAMLLQELRGDLAMMRTERKRNTRERKKEMKQLAPPTSKMVRKEPHLSIFFLLSSDMHTRHEKLKEREKEIYTAKWRWIQILIMESDREGQQKNTRKKGLGFFLILIPHFHFIALASSSCHLLSFWVPSPAPLLTGSSPTADTRTLTLTATFVRMLHTHIFPVFLNQYNFSSLA